MRAAGTAQTGQGTLVWVEVTEMVIRDAAVSRRHESRRSEVVSGNKREKKAVPSIQVCCEQEVSLSLNIHPYGLIGPHHQKRARTALPWNTHTRAKRQGATSTGRPSGG